MMYENATVLDYKGKKIWIKHIEKQLYCVNGRYIAFNPKQDISKPVTVAMALDEFYSPLLGDTDEQDLISFSFMPSGNFMANSYYLGHQAHDMNLVQAVKHEYSEWAKHISESEIYIDDCRDMDLLEWFNHEERKLQGDIV